MDRRVGGIDKWEGSAQWEARAQWEGSAQWEGRVTARLTRRETTSESEWESSEWEASGPVWEGVPERAGCARNSGRNGRGGGAC
jgi:hypothetical protein